MGAAGGYISGGPIYQRNKALFLQQRGWSVYYISCCHGKIYISGLEDFIVETCTFLTKPPYLFPPKKQQILLNYILKKNSTSNGGRSNRNRYRLYYLLGRVIGREIKWKAYNNFA